MSAFQLYLEPWLEDVVMAGCLTVAEAWQVMDEHLQSMEELVLLPEELWSLAQRIYLFEMEADEQTLH